MLRTISLVLLGLAATLTSATPDKLEDLEKFGLSDDMSIEEFMNVKTRVAAQLTRRADQNTFNNGLPGCDDEGDPSYVSGTSKYTDGVGIEIDRESNCDNGKPSRQHCWTDIFYVNHQVEYSDWINTRHAIDCSTTSSCSKIDVNLNQTCTTNTQSVDDAIQVSVEAKLNYFKEVLDFGVGLTHTHNVGGSRSTLTCTTDADQSSCVWDDKNCHNIWKAKRNRRIHGYARRSCDTPRDGAKINMPNTERRGDGYYTVGMLDFCVVYPLSQIAGCAASCSDIDYPKPKPGDEPLFPITESWV